MAAIYSVAVFCGSRNGHDPGYAAAARALGQGLAAAGIRLVFGGGRVGLMGEVANGVLDRGGSVLGVIPTFLTNRERAHPGAEIVETDSMHSRKALMFRESDAFVIMPGGLGTLDEMFEIITWRQLGLHDKPILLCDILGFAKPLVAAVAASEAAGFIYERERALFEVCADVPAVLKRLSELPAAAGERDRMTERL